MTITEIYDKNSIELGYDNFLHWLDCSDYEHQPDIIIEWTTEIMNREMYTLTQVKALMSLARDRGERHGEILYDEWVGSTLNKI